MDVFAQFVLLFNKIDSVSTQEELMQLYFNIVNEKKNGIEYLREIIILRDAEQANYTIMRDSLINLNKYHESSEVSMTLLIFIDMALQRRELP